MAVGGLRLIVVEGPDKGARLELERLAGDLSIGREVDPERHFLLRNDQRISRLHATIKPSERGYQLVDLSLNGTARNGELLERERPVLLQSGDELHFGPNTVMRFEEIARAEPPPPPPPPKPVDEFGRFQIYRSLMTSDADRVDHAVDRQTGTDVALKRITSKLINRSIKRDILDEVGRARSWDHPAIARLIDAGEHEGAVFVAQQYVDGESLAALHRDHATDIDAELAAYIAGEACSAIAYLLEREPGFVHRHLSPRCFMLGRDGRVVMINYGSPPYEVRVGGSQSGNRFQANEARQNKQLDPRSDVCSLGRILYELLSHEQINPRVPVLPDVATIRPDVPPALAQIANKAVKLHPPQRFASAAVMAEELSRALRGLDPGYGQAQAAQWMARHFPAD